jgi:hypothetical protein
MISGKEVKKVWTEQELQSLPEDGFIHEVIDGELLLRPKKIFATKTFAVAYLSPFMILVEYIVWVWLQAPARDDCVDSAGAYFGRKTSIRSA